LRNVGVNLRQKEMTDKFDIKDYFNYSISGLLWIIIIIIFLDLTTIIDTEKLFELNQLNNSGIFITLILLFGSYLIGSLFRFTEKVIVFLTNKLYGDFYSSALCIDRDKYLKSKPKEQISKLGLFYYFFKKKPLGIGGKASKRIEGNLKKLNIFNKSKKKNQYLMSETYLIMNYDNLRYERLKNLKNFFESISLPIFIISFWVSRIIVCSDTIEWFFKTLLIAIILLVNYKFIDRYRYLKSNYIKDIYRYFLFEIKQN